MDLPAGFDPSTMTYLATQLVQPTVGGAVDPYQDMLLPVEMQQSAYTDYGSDDLNLGGMPPQGTPQLKRFSSTYDDPFSDVVSAFDNPTNQDQTDPETPSIDRDNKLLGFSLPSYEYALLDYSYRRTTISLSAQLHGMFFLAESPWASGGDTQPPPNELTCYRRNLFQITGEIVLPRTLSYIMTDAGEQIRIIGQELMITATESTEGNSVKIISVPWKTPANSGGPTTDDKTEREPPSIPLDLMNVQDLDTDFASFPFQWKRLQFRIATANNGRRKELQQHFVVRLKIVATLATGGKICICEVSSGAIIVRGRSPRNFQSRKDLPLNGNSSQARKQPHAPGQLSRTSTGDSSKRQNEGPTSAPVKMEAQAPTMSMHSIFETNEPLAHTDYYEWKGPSPIPQVAMTAVPPHTTQYNNGNVYAISSPDMTRVARPIPPPPAPINLSLVEDDSPPPGSNPTPDGRASKKAQMMTRRPSFGLNTINSPDESADLLYEYFPLGLDDWMPPVDAVYRPHVVHHTKLPTDPRDPKSTAKSKSKRYFSEDVS